MENKHLTFVGGTRQGGKHGGKNENVSLRDHRILMYLLETIGYSLYSILGVFVISPWFEIQLQELAFCFVFDGFMFGKQQTWLPLYN